MIDFTDLILKFARQAGITLTEKQARLLSLHIKIMLDWNPRLNLTRITESEEIIVKHLLDSIVPAKHLPSSGHALDVGTGAGFPGIPLKIVYPGLQMVLLDSSRKKVSFLTAVTALLGLNGIGASHARWQEFSKAEEHHSKFELITMRALKFEPEHVTSLASSVLAPGGVLAWWGAGDSENLAEGEYSDTDKKDYQDVEFQGCFDYSLPGIKQRRAVWLWKKQLGIKNEELGIKE